MVMTPAEQLRPYVASYIDYDMAGWPPGRHRGLPGGTLPLVISLGSPPVVRRAGHPDVSAAATVGGLRTEPVEIIHDGSQRGIQLELTPRGARALLGLRAADLASGVWSLDEVIGRRAEELTDRLAEASGPPDRARVLDTVLAGWIGDTDGYPPAVDALWRRLTRSVGAVSVTSIAREIGLSRRHLGQLAGAELGVAPKALARILRFSQAGRFLRTGRTRSLAETAVTCGYFDQAHLTNEWKRLAGCTPGEWMAQELPFLQDQGPAGRAS